MNPDDVIRWPCGTECYRHELPEFSHKSDDYEVLPPESYSHDGNKPIPTTTPLPGVKP